MDTNSTNDLSPDSISIWETQFRAFIVDEVESEAGHDVAHVLRVVANAKRLGTAEQAEMAVVIPAAWLHDCVYVPKNSPQRKEASRLAAERATNFLHEIEYPADYIPAIAHAIHAHSFSANIPPETLEAKIVQDADRLEAIGAIGIARCIMTGVNMQSQLYHQDDPFAENNRPLNDTTYMIDHFYKKLLLLVDTMQTEYGHLEAEQRTQYMHNFLHQLSHEIGTNQLNSA